jgi:putative ABC transport system ATP-binding protein
MIEIRRLAYTYKRGKSILYPDWSLQQGQHALVSGKSGSGKTTLLLLISGLLKRQQGEIIVCDRKLEDLKGTELDRFRGKNIGIISGQPPIFIPNFNIQDNLLLAQRLGTGSENIERVYILMHELGIAGKAMNFPHELNPLESRIVTIIRAVINRPRIILADEPTQGLGEKDSMKVFRTLIGQSMNYESTLIIATQDSGIREIFKYQLKLENV